MVHEHQKFHLEEKQSCKTQFFTEPLIGVLNEKLPEWSKIIFEEKK